MGPDKLSRNVVIELPFYAVPEEGRYNLLHVLAILSHLQGEFLQNKNFFVLKTLPENG
jgi:hypothetical protein